MTGIQALERIAPGLPMKPGGSSGATPRPVAGFDVKIGKVVGVIGDTRTEQDFFPSPPSTHHGSIISKFEQPARREAAHHKPFDDAAHQQQRMNTAISEKLIDSAVKPIWRSALEGRLYDISPPSGSRRIVAERAMSWRHRRRWTQKARHMWRARCSIYLCVHRWGRMM
jgi:hypothetical protein